jgi:hypothetical protein
MTKAGLGHVVDEIKSDLLILLAGIITVKIKRFYPTGEG